MGGNITATYRSSLFRNGTPFFQRTLKDARLPPADTPREVGLDLLNLAQLKRLEILETQIYLPSPITALQVGLAIFSPFPTANLGYFHCARCGQ